MSNWYCSTSSIRTSIFPGALRPWRFQFPIFSLALVMFKGLVSLMLYLVFLPPSRDGLSPLPIIWTESVRGGFLVRVVVVSLLSGFVEKFFTLEGALAHRNNLCLYGGWYSLGRGIQIGCSRCGHGAWLELEFVYVFVWKYVVHRHIKYHIGILNTAFAYSSTSLAYRDWLITKKWKPPEYFLTFPQRQPTL